MTTTLREWSRAARTTTRPCPSTAAFSEGYWGGKGGWEHPVVDALYWSVVTACVEIKILRRVRPESPRRPPRHRRDACSMA